MQVQTQFFCVIYANQSMGTNVLADYYCLHHEAHANIRRTEHAFQFHLSNVCNISLPCIQWHSIIFMR